MSTATLAVVGAGSWGTALALALSSRFDSIHLWAHDPRQAAALRSERENTRYLPGFPFTANVCVCFTLQEALLEATTVLTVVPSPHLRPVVERMQPHLQPGTRIVSATKGLELATFFSMSQVISSVLPPQHHVAVLSGPTFAKEIAAGEPAAVVIACEDMAIAEEIQQDFATPSLRLYASNDVIGVELGAALKNVIAIGSGLCQGLGLGSNSVAALVTRGLAEITRLAIYRGGKPRTLSGLAGLGDLVLTATGDLSRNRFVGVELGSGKKLADILSQMTMVAEGIETCRAAYRLGQTSGVDLPIINQMYEVLYREKDPREAIRQLMDRPLTSE